MIVVAVILAVALAGSLGLNTWLTYRAIRGTEKQADSRVAQVDTEGHLERLRFELDHTEKALAMQRKLTNVLKEQLSRALKQPFPDAHLAPDDVAGRVLLLAEEWSAASEARDPIPARDGGAVPDRPAARASSNADTVLIDPWSEPVP